MYNKFYIVISSLLVIYIILYYYQLLEHNSKILFKKREDDESTTPRTQQIVEANLSDPSSSTPFHSTLRRISISANKKDVGPSQDKRFHQNNSRPFNKVWTGGWAILPAPRIDLSQIELINQKIVRPDACLGCFPHYYNYTILNKNICEVKNNKSVDLFIIIFTHHKNSPARKSIRRTWTSPYRGKNSNVRYAFVLGQSSNSTLNERVKEEAMEYQDIIMEDFLESYGNLTLKTVMGLKYASKFCNNTNYVLKTDDDVWINIPRLLALLKKRKHQLNDAMVGYCAMQRTPVRGVSKYHISKRLYPHELYPMFCSGTGYIMKFKTATDIYKVSKDIPFFPLEDVYVGFCVKKLGYHVKHWEEFNINTIPRWNPKFNPCSLKSTGIVTFHHVWNMDAIWRAKCGHTIFAQSKEN